MSIQPIYKERWLELFVCALVVAVISLFVNIQDPAGIVIMTSLASTALALMVAPEARTNSVRTVLISYAVAILVSVVFGLVFFSYIDAFFVNENLLFFIKFFLMLVTTLLLFGYFDAYHPPSIGAMLTYLIAEGFDDLHLILFVSLSVIFLLVFIKCYLYQRPSNGLDWKDFGKEFTREFRGRKG